MIAGKLGHSLRKFVTSTRNGIYIEITVPGGPSCGAWASRHRYWIRMRNRSHIALAVPHTSVGIGATTQQSWYRNTDCSGGLSASRLLSNLQGKSKITEESMSTTTTSCHAVFSSACIIPAKPTTLAEVTLRMQNAASVISTFYESG